MAETTVELLSELIGFHTDNPGGDEPALCRRLGELLESRGADHTLIVEVPRDGQTGGYVFATFGAPELLINVHIDTVPANTGWSRDPWLAKVTDDRVVGLGSSDTKGAIAAVVTALARETPRNVGILFSGDEEHGTTCIRHFIDQGHHSGIARAIVCEPTARRAGVRHRGVSGYRATFRGKGGHSSKADTMPKPVVVMAKLAVALDELGIRYLDRGPDDMKGLCMNVAGLDGGVAFNVVPDEASLYWSTRPPPGFDKQAFEAEVAALINAIDPAIRVEPTLGHQPFACSDEPTMRALLADHVDHFVPLDFWTEAAVLSTAGIAAIVVGPGDIAQAHAADEFVAIADLHWATTMFEHVFSTTRAGA